MGHDMTMLPLELMSCILCKLDPSPEDDDAIMAHSETCARAVICSLTTYGGFRTLADQIEDHKALVFVF